nr:MAG TPA: hypothetical protein [Caudoviricetes sp.]
MQKSTTLFIILLPPDILVIRDARFLVFTERFNISFQITGRIKPPCFSLCRNHSYKIACLFEKIGNRNIQSGSDCFQSLKCRISRKG